MKFSVFATLAAFAVAQPASAAIITITATGTVASGFDQSGLFGDPNSDLTGALFSSTLVFDTTQGDLRLGTPTEVIAGGIHFNNNPLSPGHGSVTVNGVTAPNSGNVYSVLTAGPSGSQGTVINRSWADHVTVEDEISMSAALPAGFGLLDNYHTDCLLAFECRGGFYFSNYHYDTVPGQPQYYLFQDTAQFNVTSYDIVVSGAVPEPATWAVMILGFGLVGGALRRRANAEAAA